jgi:trans-aconitate 2-methyltransferase
MSEAWEPRQYEKFRAERMQPFEDLVALIERPLPGEPPRAIDLGCGTAQLTATLADRLGAQVEAIDSSPAMLAKAAPHPRVAVREGDIASVADYARFDLVFSNAALHWVPEHEVLFGRILGAMRPGAQIAVQMPRNGAHASHRVAEELAHEPRFAGPLTGYDGRSHLLSLERYAELFYAHGFARAVASERIYGHLLASTGEVVEWVRGTLLTGFLSRLDEATGRAFLEVYRERLLATIGDRAPYFYTYRRVLLWGRKGGG